MINNLLLMRHFKTDTPVEGAFYGSTDLAIEEAEVRSFSEVGFPVYSSPMLRCRQTVEKSFPGVDPVILDDAREVDFGKWEGLTFEQIAKAYPQQVQAWQQDPDFAFPGGESIKDFTARIDGLRSFFAKASESTAVLVAHAGVIRFLICRYLGLPIKNSLIFQVDPGSVSEVKIFENGKGVLAGLNKCGDERWLK